LFCYSILLNNVLLKQLLLVVLLINLTVNVLLLKQKHFDVLL